MIVVVVLVVLLLMMTMQRRQGQLFNECKLCYCLKAIIMARTNKT